MTLKRLLTAAIGFTALFCANAAEVTSLNEFKVGSYRQILATQAGKPFILIIWSLSCSSCIKDMELLDAIHKQNPRLTLIMLSTDDPTE